jgi:Uri superfamily endonuclease
MKGIYVLILRLDESRDIRVGKLGRLYFRRGYYAYVGSARGSGGFKRVTRHFNVAHGKNTTRKWHIDYLLPHSLVICAVFSPTDKDLECIVAKTLGEFSEGIEGFGCTDCSCASHLFFTDKNITGEAAKACEGASGNESILIGSYDDDSAIQEQTGGEVIAE